MESSKEIIYQARYAKRHNWLQARNILERGLEENPGSEELAYELAMLYFNRNQFKLAIKACQRALLFESSDRLNYLSASSFLNLREYEIAIDYFNRIKEEFPEHLYNKAVALARLKRYEEAITLTEKVLSYGVKSQVPYVFLGELHYLKKEYKETINICNKAENIYGPSGELHFLRGMSWRALQNVLKAYWDFHKAEVFKIRNTEYYRNYGLVAEGLGKIEKAISLFRESIKCSPESIASYMELFRLYLSNDMLIEASSLLKQAKNSLPESFPLTVMYNRVLDKLQESNH